MMCQNGHFEGRAVIKIEVNGRGYNQQLWILAIAGDVEIRVNYPDSQILTQTEWP